MSIKSNIKKNYSSFKKANQRLADYVLNDPQKFLEQTAVDVADQCGTSSASVIRFVRKLGFKGLNEFKIQLSFDLAEENLEKDLTINTIVGKDDSIKDLCLKMTGMMQNTNFELFHILDENELSKAIDCIDKGRRINLLGIGASMLPAYDLYHKLRRIDKDARYEFDYHMGVEFGAFDTQEDVIVAFSYSGLSKEILYRCEIAKEKGATVIAVTRNAPSRLRELADIILSVPDAEHITRVGAFSSKYASMEIADILYLGVLQKSETMYEKSLINTSVLTRRIKKIGE